jgi:hypothetical protein
MKNLLLIQLLFGSLLTTTLPASAADQTSFLGEWALYPPGGAAGWLGVSCNADGLHAEMMWIGGSVLPLEHATVADGKLLLTRSREVDGKAVAGKPAKIKLVEKITVTLDGSSLQCASVTPKPDGQGADRSEFSGKRLPPIPPAPDLSQVKFGEPIQLFNGHTLAGWRLTYTNADNGWGVRDGILFNEAAPVGSQPPKHFGNLRTDAEFEDFFLHAETRLAKEGNSGIYLRGIYEVQVFDSFGKPLDSHNLGALYSRITPTVSAEKPAGEWQTLDITLVNRHVTVVLNGKTIIANQLVLGPTGGALWSEVDRPGPIYLQGDHTGIEYRNLVLRPVVGR